LAGTSRTPEADAAGVLAVGAIVPGVSALPAVSGARAEITVWPAVSTGTWLAR